MLNNEEADTIFFQLLQILHDTKFDHVVDQVGEHIRLGKLESKKVKVSDISEDDYLVVERSLPGKRPATSRKSKTEMFTSNVEYTSFEKLSILLQAIERATIDLSQMQGATAKIFATKDPAFPTSNERPLLLTFKEDFSDEERTASPEDISLFERECQALQQLLLQIRSELNAPSS